MLVEHCRRLVGHDERFVYAYYPGVDTVAHEFGLHDEYYRARARVRGRARRPPARRAAVARDARRHRGPRPGARRRQLGAAAPAARDVQVLRGGGPLPLPLREQGRGGRAARGRPRRVRRPGVGVLPRPAARRGLARPGTGHRVDPAPGRRRHPRPARADRASWTRTCRTRPTSSAPTARSPPTRCSSPSSPPAAEADARSGGVRRDRGRIRALRRSTPLSPPQGRPQHCGQVHGYSTGLVAQVVRPSARAHRVLDARRCVADRRRRRRGGRRTASRRSASPTTATCTASSTCTRPPATPASSRSSAPSCTRRTSTAPSDRPAATARSTTPAARSRAGARRTTT